MSTVVASLEESQVVEDVFSLNELVEGVRPVWECLDVLLEEARVSDDLKKRQ